MSEAILQSITDEIEALDHERADRLDAINETYDARIKALEQAADLVRQANPELTPVPPDTEGQAAKNKRSKVTSIKAGKAHLRPPAAARMSAAEVLECARGVADRAGGQWFTYQALRDAGLRSSSMDRVIRKLIESGEWETNGKKRAAKRLRKAGAVDNARILETRIARANITEAPLPGNGTTLGVKGTPQGLVLQRLAGIGRPVTLSELITDMSGACAENEVKSALTALLTDQSITSARRSGKIVYEALHGAL